MVIYSLIFPYPSGLLHWHCGNLTIAPVPAKQPWWIWINTSCEFIMNDCITTTKQSTIKPRAYFLGYTVHTNNYDQGSPFAVFCCGLYHSILPNTSWLLHCYRGNHTLAPLLVMKSWKYGWISSANPNLTENITTTEDTLWLFIGHIVFIIIYSIKKIARMKGQSVASIILPFFITKV